MAWSLSEIPWRGSAPTAYTDTEQAEFYAALNSRVALLEPKCTEDLDYFCSNLFQQSNRFFKLSDGQKRIWFLFSQKTGSWRFAFSFNTTAAADIQAVRQLIVDRLMAFRNQVAIKICWYPDNNTTGESVEFAAIQPLIDAHQDAGGKTVQKQQLPARDIYSIEAP